MERRESASLVSYFIGVREKIWCLLLPPFLLTYSRSWVSHKGSEGDGHIKTGADIPLLEEISF